MCFYCKHLVSFCEIEKLPFFLKTSYYSLGFPFIHTPPPLQGTSYVDAYSMHTCQDLSLLPSILLHSVTISFYRSYYMSSSLYLYLIKVVHFLQLVT
jgi:hypothetical protein